MDSETFNLPGTGESKRWDRMAYMYRTDKGEWTLYNRQVRLNGGRDQTIYFFSRDTPKSGVPTELPTGYTVSVMNRTGMPILKKA